MIPGIVVKLYAHFAHMAFRSGPGFKEVAKHVVYRLSGRVL